MWSLTERKPFALFLLWQCAIPEGMPTLLYLPARHCSERRKQLSLRRRAVASDVVPHVLAQDLRGGLSLRATRLDKFLADFPLDPQPQPGVFDFECHGVSVTSGYTRVHPI